MIKEFVNRRRFPNDSFKGFSRNTKAIRYTYSFNLGKFPQVRAFTPNNHEFCFVNILKTKHIGTHMFPSFNRTDCSLAAITSLLLSSLDDSFRARRGSDTRLLKQGLFEHTHERSLCSKESFYRGCARVASLPPEYRGKDAKKKRPKGQCASRQEVIQ